MDIHFTARRFKAHKAVRNYALNSLKKLDKYYDGIKRSDIILSFERKTNSVKTAEINLHINGMDLNAKETSDDFTISIDRAIEKLVRQLDRVKNKVRQKDKRASRKLKEGAVGPESENEEE